MIIISSTDTACMGEQLTCSIHIQSSWISSITCIGPCYGLCVMFYWQFSDRFRSYFLILIPFDKPLSLVCDYACTFAAYNHWADNKWRMVSEELCSCQSSRVWGCKSWWCKCCFWWCWGMLCLYFSFYFYFIFKLARLYFPFYFNFIFRMNLR